MYGCPKFSHVSALSVGQGRSVKLSYGGGGISSSTSSMGGVVVGHADKRNTTSSDALRAKATKHLRTGQVRFRIDADILEDTGDQVRRLQLRSVDVDVAGREVERLRAELVVRSAEHRAAANTGAD